MIDQIFWWLGLITCVIGDERKGISLEEMEE